MLSGIRNFITRHRRKFIVTGVVIGGTFFAIKYAQNKIIELQDRQAREFFEKTRRMNHFESTERTCNQAIIGMGIELCQAILTECRTEDLVEQLRQNPSNKLELWEEMKIISFTRLATFIYASSMLVIVLRIQLNLLGGYLYRDTTVDQKNISEELQQQYLSLIRHFLHDGGLTALIHLIRSKVVSTMKPLVLTKRFSLADIEQLFWSLQMAINSDSSDPNSKMAMYLLPTDVPEYGTGGPLLRKMYNETLDLLESDDAATVCSNNVCRGFSLAIDAIAESMGEFNSVTESHNPDPTPKTSEMNAQSSSNNNSPMLNINNVQMPLAKIIPILSGLTSKGFDSSSHPQNLPTSLITFYVVAEKSKILGANVYETFSSS